MRDLSCRIGNEELTLVDLIRVSSILRTRMRSHVRGHNRPEGNVRCENEIKVGTISRTARIQALESLWVRCSTRKSLTLPGRSPLASNVQGSA
jgi:hypothetical protein